MARWIALLLAAVLAGASLTTGHVAADQLLSRSLKLSDNQAAVQANWQFGFTFTSNAPVALLSFQVCSNDPYPDGTCTIPDGLDMRAAVLNSQIGNTGFAVSPSTTANRLLLQRAGAPANLAASIYSLSGIVNPSADGSYYVRVQSYATSYVSGSGNNFGGIAFAITQNVQITATVPPYLLFCVGVTVAGYDCDNVSGNYVNFGELSSRQAAQGTTQMLAATNAIDGYTIRVSGPTLTSGNNIITNLVGSDSSHPGTSQFGMNLRANSVPQGGLDVSGAGSGLPTNGYSQINNYRFNPGDVVAASTTPDLARKYTTTYLVNVPKSQAPGIYVSTMTYVALGSF